MLSDWTPVLKVHIHNQEEFLTSHVRIKHNVHV